MPTPRITRSPILTPLSIRTRATPQPPYSTSCSPSHHKTADELALEEAASILHTPAMRLRSTGSMSPEVLDSGSARALRHQRLTQARQGGEAQGERSQNPQINDKEKKKDEQAVSRDDSLANLTHRACAEGVTEDEDDEASRELGGVSGLSDSGSIQIVEHGENNQSEDVPLSASLSTGQIFAQAGDRVKFEASESVTGSETVSGRSSSDSLSSSNSDTESDSESDSDGKSSSFEEFEESDPEDIAQSHSTKPAAADQGSSKGESDGEQDLMLRFDKDQLNNDEAPIPDLSIPKLPQNYLASTKDTRAAHSASVQPSRRPSQPFTNGLESLELDDRPYERPLTKQEKALQPRKATISQLWASIPTPRADLLPQMKKDYQALALANTLDPKRFMKNGSKSNKVPESFAIGTMVETSRRLKDTTITKESKYRPGQVVQNIIRDEHMDTYAKRKYDDLQRSKMENGRGKGWKKRAKWQ
nr:hypothetical protein L204_05583 [Cryptococcus depauperatus CBS 7855]